MRNETRYIAMLLMTLTVLLGASCNSDEATQATSADGTWPTVGFAVGERTWADSQVSITRSGETLESLMDGTGTGFGLYSTRLNMTNTQVTWNDTKSRWSYGTSTLLWPDNVVKYSVAFNNKTVSYSAGSYFTLEGTASDINTKFKDCTYHGVKYVSALKLYSDTRITWLSGANGNKTKVTIVQSDWKAEGKTLKQIVFDGVVLNLEGETTSSDGWVAKAKAIPGGVVYIIKNVPPRTDPSTPHEIKRNDEETGIFYVSVDVDFYAYAPSNNPGSTPYGGYSDGKLSFSCPIDNSTDLLWAEDSVSTDGTVHLNFRHALAKVAFGTFTNNYGYPVTVKQVKLEGSISTSGTLSLTDGTWSNLSAASSESQVYTPGTSPVIADGEIAVNKADGGYDFPDFLLIPNPTAGPTLTATVTVNSEKFGDEDIVFNITLEKGKCKTVNITIKNNHEVVISGT